MAAMAPTADHGRITPIAVIVTGIEQSACEHIAGVPPDLFSRFLSARSHNSCTGLLPLPRRSYLLRKYRHIELHRRACWQWLRIGYNISFRSQTGAIGIIQSASILDEIYPMERLEIVGDRRNIVVDNIKNFIYNRPPVSSKQNYEPFAIDDAGDALVWNPSHGDYPRYSHHGYENGLRYFFDCLQAGKLPQPDIHDSVRTMELIDQLNQKIGESKSPMAFSPS